MEPVKPPLTVAAASDGGGRKERASAILLRYWLLITGVVLGALLVWAFAPVLVFMGLLAVALGLLSALMIKLARALQAWRERRQGDGLR